MTGRLLLVVVISVWLGAPCLASDAAREAPPKGAHPLEGLGFEVGGETRAISGLEVVGLATIDEARLWAMVEKPATPFEFARAAALVEALDRSQAFARIEPRLRVGASGELTLVVRVTEHPRVEAVDVQGLDEAAVSELLPELLGTPVNPRESPAPAPFASLEAGTLRPGILRGGVAGAITRLVTKLFGSGSLMVGIQGTLSADGKLTVVVDEGRLEEVRLVGPAPRLWAAVQRALDLPPGRTFDQAELGDALKRVERALPFLRADAGPHPTRALPSVETSSDGDGIRFVLRESPQVARPGGFSVEGRRLTLFFQPKLAVRFRVPPDELLRHTPVGGFGIGIQTETKLWDPKDRVHLRLDTFGGTIDSAAAEALGTDDSRSEYDLTLRLRVPPLRIADLSVSGHGYFDTPDAWRTGRQTSYLNSLFFDRPDREYYWREGWSLSLTLQPAERLLIGAEYRGDSYRSIASLADPATFFNHDDRFVNPPIQEGNIGSVVLRAELGSEPVNPEQIRGLFRTPETSIVTQERSWGLRTGYQLLATVELARPGLGSDAGMSFTRLVSDDMVFLATGPDSGLRLRARVAGGSNLPLQKQEALGGWSALRGHEFKEFRGGDWSWLGTVEYRHEWLSGFVDVGSVRQPQGWTGPHAGAGLKLHFDSLPVVGRWLRNRRLLPPIQLAVAWRLDQAGKADPSVRLLIGQIF
jgi:hypothetical protein